jgi:hypothetical protein
VAEWVVAEWVVVVELVAVECVAAEWVVVEWVAAVEWAAAIKWLVGASSPASEQNAATLAAGIGFQLQWRWESQCPRNGIRKSKSIMPEAFAHGHDGRLLSVLRFVRDAAQISDAIGAKRT